MTRDPMTWSDVAWSIAIAVVATIFVLGIVGLIVMEAAP